MKTVITFGSKHLEWMHHKLNPMNVALVIEAENMTIARQVVFHSKIGEFFCTSYSYDNFKESFKKHIKIREYSLEDLEANILTKEIVWEIIKDDVAEWEESHDYWNGSTQTFIDAPIGWDVNVIGSTYADIKENEYKAVVTKVIRLNDELAIGSEEFFSFMISEMQGN